jgi:nucleotide-binding universal stress UspA family protein
VIGGKMFKKILVPLDGSKLAEFVIPYARMIGDACQAAQIIFTRVIEPIVIPAVSPEYFSADVYTQMEAQAKQEAESYLKQLVQDTKFERATVDSKILYGRAADSLVDYAHNNKVDLIIIATHGRSGLSRWIRGSVANRVLQSAKLPVLTIPPVERK